MTHGGGQDGGRFRSFVAFGSRGGGSCRWGGGRRWSSRAAFCRRPGVGTAARDQRCPRRRVDPEIRDGAGDPAGDAAQRQVPRQERGGGRLLPDRSAPVRAGDPPGRGRWVDQGVELRLGRTTPDVSPSGVHDRRPAWGKTVRVKWINELVRPHVASGCSSIRLTRRSTGRTRPAAGMARWAWHRPRPATAARCRSSPTYTGATVISRATATRRQVPRLRVAVALLITVAAV